MTRSRIADLGHRVLPAVLVLAGLAVMTTGIIDGLFGTFALTKEDMVDDSGMNARIQWACVPILAGAGWALLARRRWWVPAALATPVILVGLPTLAEGVPRNGVPFLGFLPAAMLVTAGVIGNAMGPRLPR